MNRTVIKCLLWIVLIVVCGSGCEKLLQIGYEPVDDCVSSEKSIEDYLNLPLVGFYEYPPLMRPETASISSIVSFLKQSDGFYSVESTFYLNPPHANHSGESVFWNFRIGKGIYDEVADKLTVYPDNGSGPILTIRNHALYGCIDVEYNLTSWYNQLYPTIIQPVQDESIRVLCQDYESVYQFLFETKAPYGEPPRVPSLSLRSGELKLKERDSSYYATHRMNVRVGKHTVGDGYTCVVKTTLDLIPYGGVFRELEFALPYGTVDINNQEIRFNYVTWGMEHPYFRLVYHPEVSSLVLYWTPGKYFQDLYHDLYEETHVPSIPLCDEELEIRMSFFS